MRFDLQTCGEWQSLLLPQGRPAPQFGAQGCGTHTAFRQIFDPQFPLSLHAIPLPQFGEQAGAWQSPDMQIPVPQSPPIPQGLPVGHLPGWVAQTGDLHKFDPHTKDAQFELLLHNDPFPQLGEQAGGAHRPCTQTFDPQSLSDPHGLFSLHLLGAVAQGGGAHLPAVHTDEAQSLGAVHGWPVAHDGEQVGTAQIPALHSPDAQSAFDPHFVPTPQVGAHDGGAHVPFVQIPDWQSAFPVQGLPDVQLGEQADQSTHVAWYRRVPSVSTYDCSDVCLYPFDASEALIAW